MLMIGLSLISRNAWQSVACSLPDLAVNNRMSALNNLRRHVQSLPDSCLFSCHFTCVAMIYVIACSSSPSSFLSSFLPYFSRATLSALYGSNSLDSICCEFVVVQRIGPMKCEPTKSTENVWPSRDLCRAGASPRLHCQ